MPPPALSVQLRGRAAAALPCVGWLLLGAALRGLARRAAARRRWDAAAAAAALVLIAAPRAAAALAEWRLRRRYARPTALVLAKVLRTLDANCAAVIALSPFLVLATTDAAGRVDASPRGDPPGELCRVVDERTLLIPDRGGNNRLDSLTNVTRCSAVHVMFMIPGWRYVLRVLGDAEITHDAALLRPLARGDVVPHTGLLIHVREAYPQCGKAVIRADLWGPRFRPADADLPPLGGFVSRAIRQTGRGAAEAEVETAAKMRAMGAMEAEFAAKEAADGAARPPPPRPVAQP